MRVAFLDLETFWSTTHSLSKLNPISYCMHRETEIQSLACAFGKGEVVVVFGEDHVRQYIASHDWSDTLVVGHNLSGFDAMLLKWRLGLKPKAWGCTLAMARPIYRAEAGGSLKKLCDHLGFGAKGDLEAIGTKGRKLSSFTRDERVQMSEYNKQDVALCRRLFYHLLPMTPAREMALIDLTVRMLVNPRFRVDVPLLQDTLVLERERKDNALNLLGAALQIDDPVEVKAQLMSNLKFANLLMDLGVEPPTKTSPTTGQETYAFAKSDEGLKELLDHDDPLVRSAVETRLGVKSSILETRLERFIEMAAATGGRMPIALNYWGAHTGRFSGAFKVNQQNLPRVNPKKPQLTDALRGCLLAPPGHKIVVADLSGIELRVNHYLWNVKESMDLYAQDPKADLYEAFAAKFYGVRVEEVNKDQRQFAKMMQLALGFSMGWRKFQTQAKAQGYTLTDREAKDAVGKWRDIYSDIVLGWEECNNALSCIASGDQVPIDAWGLCQTDKDRVDTPGAALRYPHLRYEDDTWVYGEGRFKSRIFGGKLVENLVQHIARQILVEQMLRIDRRYPVAHTVHDEVITIVPEEEAETTLAFMLDTMKTSPSWWPDIVLWAEGSIGTTYAEAK